MKKWWSFYVLLIFFIVRIILNLRLAILPIVFVIIYLVLIFLLIKKSKIFTKFLIWFLIIDSLIGTYFLINGVLTALIYTGTIAVNLIMIWVAIKHSKGPAEKVLNFAKFRKSRQK